MEAPLNTEAPVNTEALVRNEALVASQAPAPLEEKLAASSASAPEALAKRESGRDTAPGARRAKDARSAMPVPSSAPAPPPSGPVPLALAAGDAKEAEAGREIVATGQPITDDFAALQAEDIGELRDTNVAESLRRRPSITSYGYFDSGPVRTTVGAISTLTSNVGRSSYGLMGNSAGVAAQPRKAETVRLEELVNYFDYAWPQPNTREEPFEPTIIVSDSPWGAGKKLVHIGIKGYQADAQQRPDANLVLLVDVSSSMDDVDRLPVVKEAMRLMLSSLKPSDTVAIVVYSDKAGVALAPTRVTERQKIWRAIESLQPQTYAAPGTPGLKLAYEVAAAGFRRDGMNRILLCTDGEISAGMSGPLTLQRLVERERDQGIFLSVLGFGMGAYRGELAHDIARHGNGIAVNVQDVQDARRVLVEQATGTSFTIAKAVRFQVEFDVATVAEWRLVGYEARELKGGGVGDGSVNAGDVGSGHAATAIYEITPVAAPGGAAGDYGHLSIRYKLPGGFRSRLIERPIGVATTPPGEALRRDVEFSTAVAGFAQLLSGGRYTGALTYEDVARQAEAARGEDPFGYRAEFVRLVRQAQRAGR